MEIKNTVDYRKFIADTFDHLKAQFLEKSDQYGDVDPLGNFRTGAALSFGDCDTEGMYEVLKGYMNKHVAHVYNHNLHGVKVDESWKDIAIYSAIALYMLELHRKEQAQKNN